ncbi:hypothetical protein BDV06DRAFT_117790 [Aspergillus oleicola]
MFPIDNPKLTAPKALAAVAAGVPAVWSDRPLGEAGIWSRQDAGSQPPKYGSPRKLRTPIHRMLLPLTRIEELFCYTVWVSFPNVVPLEQFQALGIDPVLGKTWFRNLKCLAYSWASLASVHAMMSNCHENRYLPTLFHTPDSVIASAPAYHNASLGLSQDCKRKMTPKSIGHKVTGVN